MTDKNYLYNNSILDLLTKLVTFEKYIWTFVKGDILSSGKLSVFVFSIFFFVDSSLLFIFVLHTLFVNFSILQNKALVLIFILLLLVLLREFFKFTKSIYLYVYFQNNHSIIKNKGINKCDIIFVLF